MRHMNQDEFRKFAEPIDELHKGLWDLSKEHYEAKLKDEGTFLCSHMAFLETAVDTFSFAEPISAICTSKSIRRNTRRN